MNDNSTPPNEITFNKNEGDSIDGIGYRKTHPTLTINSPGTAHILHPKTHRFLGSLKQNLNISNLQIKTADKAAQFRYIEGVYSRIKLIKDDFNLDSVGSGAVIVKTITTGKINLSISPGNGGTGYSQEKDEVLILDENGKERNYQPGEFTLNITNGTITGITVNDSQSIYQDGDTAIIVRKNGNVALADVTIDNTGVISSFEIKYGGFGYDIDERVFIAAPIKNNADTSGKKFLDIYSSNFNNISVQDRIFTADCMQSFKIQDINETSSLWN